MTPPLIDRVVQYVCQYDLHYHAFSKTKWMSVMIVRERERLTHLVRIQAVPTCTTYCTLLTKISIEEELLPVYLVYSCYIDKVHGERTLKKLHFLTQTFLHQCPPYY